MRLSSPEDDRTALDDCVTGSRTRGKDFSPTEGVLCSRNGLLPRTGATLVGSGVGRPRNCAPGRATPLPWRHGRGRPPSGSRRKDSRGITKNAAGESPEGAIRRFIRTYGTAVGLHLSLSVRSIGRARYQKRTPHIDMTTTGDRLLMNRVVTMAEADRALAHARSGRARFRAVLVA